MPAWEFSDEDFQKLEPDIISYAWKLHNGLFDGWNPKFHYDARYAVTVMDWYNKTNLPDSELPTLAQAKEWADRLILRLIVKLVQKHQNKTL